MQAKSFQSTAIDLDCAVSHIEPRLGSVVFGLRLQDLSDNAPIVVVARQKCILRLKFV